MQPGDQVQLKSGGPVMTVESLDGSYVICTWFDAKHIRKQDRFLAVTLEKYEEGDFGASMG
ncbi:MAG: YodC family protein [Steroidobacteraceae bacterium]